MALGGRGRSSRIPRRGVLAAGVAGAAGAAVAGFHQWTGGSGEGSRPVPVAGENVQQAIGTTGSATRVVQFVAHADDALFFMNPDAEQELSAGHALLTVCLTSGEADGRNVSSHDRRAHTLRPDRPGFARARINGLRRAHSVMATGDENSPWDVRAVYPIPGWGAELHTLRAAPQVKLLFLALVESRGVVAWRAQSLKGLWQGAVSALPQLLPAHSPVPQPATVTRAQVVECLHALLRTYRPTTVRTLDPNPDHDPAHTKATPHGPHYLDHQDHTHATYFLQQALAAYWAAGGAAAASVEHYLGYVNARLPFDLDGATVRRKARTLAVYGWTDGTPCGDPSGCGDRKVGGTAVRSKWVQSTRYRAPGAASWAARLPDGRLAAFALLNGQAAVWHENRPGGEWTGPALLPGTGLEGQVNVVVRPDGTLQLFSVRTVLPDVHGHGPHLRTVVTAVQHGTAGDGRPRFSGWLGLGSCEPDPVKSMEMGYPEAAAAPDGTVYLAVRNRDGGVSVRVQAPGGHWGGWTRLPKAAESGLRVLDGLAVTVDRTGRAHVLAPAQRGIVHWSSPGRGRPFALARSAGLPGAAGPVTAYALPDGALRLAYREPGTARVAVAEVPAGSGTGKVVSVGDPAGGFGRVAVLQSAPSPGKGLDQHPPAVLATRDGKGSVAVSTPAGAAHWAHGTALHVHTAALVEDSAGRTVALAVGTDGALWAARRDTAAAAAGGAADHWAPAVPTARRTAARTHAVAAPRTHSEPRTV